MNHHNTAINGGCSSKAIISTQSQNAGTGLGQGTTTCCNARAYGGIACTTDCEVGITAADSTSNCERSAGVHSEGGGTTQGNSGAAIAQRTGSPHGEATIDRDR